MVRRPYLGELIERATLYQYRNAFMCTPIGCEYIWLFLELLACFSVFNFLWLIHLREVSRQGHVFAALHRSHIRSVPRVVITRARLNLHHYGRWQDSPRACPALPKGETLPLYNYYQVDRQPLLEYECKLPWLHSWICTCQVQTQYAALLLQRSRVRDVRCEAPFLPDIDRCIGSVSTFT